MMKLKQSLTYLLGPFLIFTTIAMCIVSFLSLPGGPIHVTRTEAIKIFLFSLSFIATSLWLSNQKTENKALRITCFLMFWVSATCSVCFMLMLFWVNSWMALKETTLQLLLKYSLPFLITSAALVIGVWRYKKSTLIKFRSGFGSAAGFFLIGMFLVDYGWLQYRNKPMPALELNQKAADFSAKLRTGQSVSLKELRGKVVVLDFWASWCGPCMLGMPNLQKVFEKYERTPDVAILALNCWEHCAATERLQRIDSITIALKLTLPIVLIDDDVARLYRVKGIPTQVYIDASGIIRHVSIGYSGDGMIDEMTAVIEKLR